jgi:cytochrome c oxidase assembly factor CtaG
VLLAHGASGPLPPLTGWRYVTTWLIEPTVVGLLIGVVALYGLGVRVLRARGDSWSNLRFLWWLLGLLLIFVATSSALGVYDDTLFSVHAVQHMFLQMVAPVLLALGAPMTLALRTLPLRARQMILAVIHTRIVSLLAHPGIAFSLFSVSQFVLYYSPLYEATLRNEWLHNASHFHFVAVGFLFFWSLLAIDPVPHRPQFTLKYFFVIGLAPMHVVLGLPIMMGDRLFAPSYYLELGRTWGPSLLEDQQLGGAILWGFGDISAGVLVAAFAAQWYRSDEREARRVDRALDRVHGSAATVPPWWMRHDGAAESFPMTQRARRAPDRLEP